MDSATYKWRPAEYNGCGPQATPAFLLGVALPLFLSPCGTLNKALTIPSCRGVVWERFDERTSEYNPITVRPCEEMSPGLPLTGKGRAFEVDAPVQDGDVVRAVVVVGAKCEAGLPFELARCSQVVAVEGPTITVRGAAE